MPSTRTILFLVSLALAFVSVSGMSCPCERAKCPAIDEAACPSGTAKDLCGCCTFCAGEKDEECGGPMYVFGACGEGFKCLQDPCPPGMDDEECYIKYLTEPGRCVEEARSRHVLHMSSKQRVAKLLEQMSLMKRK
ncbi:venom protein 302-like [Oratosquilla oratoria]|uniref:venom protein 302-like n=1 Tax=Oratosquilla oratoria TaxID=337810 RepID=UPI003F76B543